MHVSAKEELKRDKAVLGDTYGAAYHHACQHLWNVVAFWDRYESLFGTADRVALLNETSGGYWHATQNMLFEYVLLGLTRLTDPPVTGGRSNLSVAQLLQLDPSRYKAQLVKLVVRAERLTIFARTWRNRRLSHNDLAEIVGTSKTLGRATRKKVRNAIMAIHDVLRWIRLKHFDGDMHLYPLGDSDTNALMVFLADGVEANQRRKDALDRRDYALAIRPNYAWLNTGSNQRYSPQRRLRVPKR